MGGQNSSPSTHFKQGMMAEMNSYST